jgi:hypothetical protein
MRLQHRTANLGSLYDSHNEFVAEAEKSRGWPSGGRVSDRMIEAMHAFLCALPWGRAGRLVFVEIHCIFP